MKILKFLGIQPTYDFSLWFLHGNRFSISRDGGFMGDFKYFDIKQGLPIDCMLC